MAIIYFGKDKQEKHSSRNFKKDEAIAFQGFPQGLDGKAISETSSPAGLILLWLILRYVDSTYRSDKTRNPERENLSEIVYFSIILMQMSLPRQPSTFTFIWI